MFVFQEFIRIVETGLKQTIPLGSSWVRTKFENAAPKAARCVTCFIPKRLYELNCGVKILLSFGREFKRSVVDHWCHGDKTAEQVAKEFGVKIWNVRDWRRRYGPTHKPVDAPMPEKPEELKRELQQLRKELARVTTQRDILKKTMGILSEP